MTCPYANVSFNMTQTREPAKNPSTAKNIPPAETKIKGHKQKPKAERLIRRGAWRPGNIARHPPPAVILTYNIVILSEAKNLLTAIDF